MYFMIIFDASVFPAPLSPEKKEEIQQNIQLWQNQLWKNISVYMYHRQ